MTMLYYQDSHVTIYQGNCLEVLGELPAESVQCCITSPPYWGLRKYSGEQEMSWGCAYGLESTPEMYVEHTIEFLRAIRRILRKDGVVFWNIGDSYWSDTLSRKDPVESMWGNRPALDLTEGRNKIPEHNLRGGLGQRPIGLKPKDLCLIPFRVALAAQEDGWYVRSIIIWSKPNPMPESVKDRPTESHEYILMLTKSQKYYWDIDAVREAHLDSSWASNMRREGKTERQGPKSEYSATTANQAFLRGNHRPERGRNIRSVWTMNTEPFPSQYVTGEKLSHFAIFPPELPRKCILAASKRNDIILDPFSGAGTTGMVSKQLGRRAILIDTSEDYCRMAQHRIEEVPMPMALV